jgi:protein-L-isoaspartate O-methyltransferase
MPIAATTPLRSMVPLILGALGGLSWTGTALDAAEVPYAAPYVPTPQSIVVEMLELAEVGPEDYVIDLGSGDGRIVITAARDYGARGLGVEINADLVTQAARAARDERVADRARFVQQDLFDTDLSAATVVSMYLLPLAVNRLRDKLLADLAVNARVVSHDYPMHGWEAERLVELHHPEKIDATGSERTRLYLYRVPADVSGRWMAEAPAGVIGPALEFEFTQAITEVEGTARIDGRVVPLRDVTVRGRWLSFTLPDHRTAQFTGWVREGRIEGAVEAAGAGGPWQAVRQ